MVFAMIVATCHGHNWTHKPGAIPAGKDVQPVQATTLASAKAECEALTGCVGLTFEAVEAAPTGVIPKVYFKSTYTYNGDADWQTWLEDYKEPPPDLYNPCANHSSVFSKQLWCDPTASLVARVGDMLSRMTIEEKIGNLGTSPFAIPSLGLPGYNWWSEASHGVASGRDTQTTNFAFPITTAMAFNRSLWRATGAQIGREGRAMMNSGDGYSTFWAPVINLAREPRWGRNLEVCIRPRPTSETRVVSKTRVLPPLRASCSVRHAL